MRHCGDSLSPYLWAPCGIRRARPRYFASLGDLADARIAGTNESAGPQRGVLEVRRIDGKDLPVRGFVSEQLNRPHRREVALQAHMMLGRRRQPHSVILWRIGPISQNENNLVLNVDRKTAEHWPRPGCQARERLEHELVGDDPAPLGRGIGFAEGLPTNLTTDFTHAICH